jgi:hypothetical protein
VIELASIQGERRFFALCWGRGMLGLFLFSYSELSTGLYAKLRVELASVGWFNVNYFGFAGGLRFPTEDTGVHLFAFFTEHRMFVGMNGVIVLEFAFLLLVSVQFAPTSISNRLPTLCGE